MHPACADDEGGPRGEREDDLREVRVVVCAGLGDAFGRGLSRRVFGRGGLVLDQVVVRPGDAGFVGAVEAFDAFAAGGAVSEG